MLGVLAICISGRLDGGYFFLQQECHGDEEDAAAAWYLVLSLRGVELAVAAALQPQCCKRLEYQHVFLEGLGGMVV